MKKKLFAIFALPALILCSCFTFVSADTGEKAINVSFVIFLTIYVALLLVVLGIMIWLIIRERKAGNGIEIEEEDFKDFTFEVKDLNDSDNSFFNQTVVLASKSPRRMQMLTSCFKEVIIEPLSIDETSDKTSPVDIAVDIAKLKIGNLADKYYDNLVISADTLVAMDNKIYGKPIDAADAEKILKELNGKQHEVITGYCICYKGICKTGSEISLVRFKTLTEQEIKDYIATGSPLDKAGAYGIQDNVTVESYEGSLDNIIGLPLDKILIECNAIINEGNENGKN